MNEWIWAFVGGLVGAVLMDITETIVARQGLASGVSVGLIGRWCLGLAQGRLRHADIRQVPAVAGEVVVGWAFHLLIGGGGVALAYPFFVQLLPLQALFAGLLFGLATSLLPWLLLLPSFGWGLFGRRGPPGTNALLASTLSHIPYGLGVATVFALGGR